MSTETRGTGRDFSARETMVREKKTESRDQIIANLTFGFWVRILGVNYEDLWRRALHRAFTDPSTGRPPSAKRIRSLVNDVRQFRNRIAHHDYAQDYDLPMLMSRVNELTKLISPQFSAWITENLPRNRGIHNGVDDRLQSRRP